MTWVPSLYFAEGLPYAIIISLSVVMYTELGLSLAEATYYTGWFYLPWLIKPLWSPFVDLLKTKRWWIVTMQLLMGAGMAGIAFTLPMENYLQWTLAIFWLMAFSSATHDVAADGFYMMALEENEQSLFVGIRSIFYRFALFVGESGLLIMTDLLLKPSKFLAWVVEKLNISALKIGLEYFTQWQTALAGNQRKVWIIIFVGVVIIFATTVIWHAIVLPRPASDVNKQTQANNFLGELAHTFITFFKKKGVIPALLFMLLFRFPEAQLVKISSPFLLAPIQDGGLGLTLGQVGWVKSLSPWGLMIGGILGGICISRGGLKRWLWPMVWAISLPDIVYVYLSYAQPSNLYLISSCLFIEQLGYGFGFTAYMMFLIYYARGTHETAHYAIATAFMAAGMMLPGMMSGALQEWMGYKGFFIWIMACCIVTFVVSAFLKIDKEFGKK